ncbi:MAG: outer membrane beta-barrel protein [Bacteroidetes bacterium]|nr:outer membrane beta-barrel protein [Bacteroidota bacterium]
MKQLITLLLCSVLVLNLSAQTDTTEIKVMKKNVVTVVEGHDKVHVKVGNDRGVEVITDDWGDTTHVRVGRRTFKVIEGDNGTYVKVEKEVKNKNWTGSFNAHWAGLEVGMNMFYKSDYSMYNGTEYEEFGEYFDLNPGKSLTWNLNFAEWAFKNERKTFAVVTGLGISFSDYTFDQNITIKKDNDMIYPDNLNSDGLQKSKLHVTYLTAPLLLEIKTPLRMGSSKLYIAGGVIGGLHIGSHTKVKYKKDKDKTKGNYHLNSFKYDVTGRIGFGDFCVFANYSMTSLFKNGKGPELFPLMVGISFPNI